MNAIAEGLLELVFPTRCAGCDLPGELLCPVCAQAIVRVRPGEGCARCGAPVRSRTCTECPGEVRFVAARCAGPLEAPLSRIVTVFKDGHEKRLAGVMGLLLVETAGEWQRWADGVAWVPATRRAVARRGFDHGALLGAEVARRMRIPALDVLAPSRAQDQRGLGKEARRLNAASAFSARAEVRGGVLLVDDVMTTGATTDAAAGALLAAGADQVRVVVLARKVGSE